jgi:hypothetical protein
MFGRNNRPLQNPENPQCTWREQKITENISTSGDCPLKHEHDLSHTYFSSSPSSGTLPLNYERNKRVKCKEISPRYEVDHPPYSFDAGVKISRLTGNNFTLATKQRERWERLSHFHLSGGEGRGGVSPFPRSFFSLFEMWQRNLTHSDESFFIFNLTYLKNTEYQSLKDRNCAPVVLVISFHVNQSTIRDVATKRKISASYSCARFIQ